MQPIFSKYLSVHIMCYSTILLEMCNRSTQCSVSSAILSQLFLVFIWTWRRAFMHCCYSYLRCIKFYITWKRDVPFKIHFGLWKNQRWPVFLMKMDEPGDINYSFINQLFWSLLMPQPMWQTTQFVHFMTCHHGFRSWCGLPRVAGLTLRKKVNF